MLGTLNKIYIIALCVYFISGCAAKKVEIREAIPVNSEAELLGKISEKNSTAINSLKVYGKGEALVKDKRVKFRIAMLLKRPAFHHIEIMSSFGKPIIIVSGDSEASYLTDFKTSRILKSEPPEKILSRVTGIMVKSNDLVDIVSGMHIARVENIKSVDITDNDGFYEITERTSGENEARYFFSTATLALEKTAFYNKETGTEETILYNGKDISFINHEGIKSFEITIEELTVNPEIPDETFTLANPLNLEIEEIQ